ncbi:MAG: DUF3604 domain-containing protein [Planctomycetota bacterium]|nr:DUF3604 domain-containing protein [Planctomycetota bacterium]
MPIRDDPKHVGRAWLTPNTPVVAGQVGTWTIGYEVGAYGYDEGGRIKIVTRFASDLVRPQFKDPKAPAYTTLKIESSTPGLACELSYETKGLPRPWYKCLVVSVIGGSLYPGDKVFVTYGDTSGGSPGARFQTFREREFEWRVYVDPFATEIYHLLEPVPKLVVAGGTLHRLVVVAPTTVRPGEPFDALVKAEDLWGNPCERFAGEVALRTEGGSLVGLPASARFESCKLAARRLEGLKLAAAGQEVRIVASADGREAVSNPIHALKPGEAKTWWADLHGQTRATVGTGTLAEYYAFARDAALLDATCHQGNDFQITGQAWRELLDETRKFHADGRFVVFPGWEWSGMTPGGGDRNVIFKSEAGAVLHRSSHAEVEDASDAETDCFPITQLYERLRGREDVVLIPHVGGRYCDIVNFHDPALEPVVEVYSDWGRFEWLIEDAIKHKRKVGFVAQSDGHKGRPGASHPGAGAFGVYGGLTCYLAEACTREALFEAIKKRRCYAVGNGQRIYIELSIAGLPMGSEGHAAGEVKVVGRVVGSGPLARVDLMRDAAVARAVSPYGTGQFANSNRFRVSWSGSAVRGRARLTVWDGALGVMQGQFAAVKPYGFANSEKGVRLVNPQKLEFVSSTTGGENGVNFTLTAQAGARVVFRSPVANADFAVKDVPFADTALVFPAGGIDREIRVRRLPSGGHRNDLSFDAALPAPGNPWSAYWIRVTQEDGTQAWTSPVYLSGLDA